MKELMLDIETLGNTPGSIVFEVGAVLFDEKGVLDTFHAFLPIYASADRGFTIALHTLEWWHGKGRSLSAIMAMAETTVPINDTMLRLAQFMDGVEQFWSKGNFDYPLMARYFDSCNLNTPWKYGQVRELRTMLCELGLRQPKADITHNALEDALQQVELLVSARGMMAGSIPQPAGRKGKIYRNGKDVHGDSGDTGMAGEKPKENKNFERGLELLRQLADLQNGPPRARYEDEWASVMDETQEFLKQHEA